MVHSEYIKYQTTDRQFLDHIAEEAAEFLMAYAKMQRWGEDSVNPELPVEQQETNIDWVHRELADLEGATKRYRARIIQSLPQTGATPIAEESLRRLTIRPFRDMNGVAAAAVISGQSGNVIGYVFYDYYKGWWYGYTEKDAPMFANPESAEVVRSIGNHYHAFVTEPERWFENKTHLRSTSL